MAYGQEVVNVYSSLSAAGTGGQIGMGIVNLLNEVQSQREYRFSSVPGAQGDTSMLRAVTEARTTKANTIVYNGVSTFSFNRINNTAPPFDRDKDFILSVGIGKNTYGLLVAPDSPINNVDDLVNTLKAKPKAFFATTLSGPGSVMLNNLFVQQFGLKNVEQINYKRQSDILQAIQNKEADYTIFTVPDMVSLKALMVSSPTRLVTFPNAPTALELKMPWFNIQSILLFAIPKEKAKFAKTFEADMKLACSSKGFERIANLRAPYLSYCLEPSDTAATVQSDLDLINKFKK
jgi:tripartite-type tricarboxylate transporter receptor subunit TctC